MDKKYENKEKHQERHETNVKATHANENKERREHERREHNNNKR